MTEAAAIHIVNLKDKIKTIAFGNSLEFAEYEKTAKDIEADIYFAHPCSS
ncbi:hypothetical protein ACJJI1_02435 [Microbulbifer sp. ZKSA002]